MISTYCGVLSMLSTFCRYRLVRCYSGLYLYERGVDLEVRINMGIREGRKYLPFLLHLLLLALHPFGSCNTGFVLFFSSSFFISLINSCPLYFIHFFFFITLLLCGPEVHLK